MIICYRETFSKDFSGILEGDETVQQQFVAASNNVSSNCANFDSDFLLSTQNVRLFIYLWHGNLLESLESIKPKHLT